MPPQLALVACYCAIVWLLRRDMLWRNAGSPALIIPGFWLAVQGSRQLSYWVGGGGGDVGGHPINTLFYASMIGAALIVLSRRKLSWGLLLQKNWAIFLIYFFFSASAFLASEMPLMSLKRLFKDFGCVIMAMVFLTLPDPASAVRTVVVRVAYALFPLSIVFIKYFPHLGRGASRAGDALFTGVTVQKNQLGEMVFLFSLIILWDLLEIFKTKPVSGRKPQIWIRVCLLLMGGWLLKTCDSKTSMLCLGIGSLVLLGLPRLLRTPNARPLLVTGLIAMVCLGGLDKTLNLSQKIAVTVGRDPNLTGRTEIWDLIRDQNTDPIIGEGYYIFWDSSKGKAVQDAFIPIKTAHNGYLEIYVDGGAIAILTLCVFLLAAGKEVVRKVFSDSPFGGIALAVFVTALLYNLSESSFMRLTPLWGMLILVAIKWNVPRWANASGTENGGCANFLPRNHWHA